MKHYILSILCTISFYTYPMLLLESSEQVHRRNAREVQHECVNLLNFFNKQYPGIVSTKHLRLTLKSIGTSEITTEQKKEAFIALAHVKQNFINWIQWMQKKEAEEHALLKKFGMVVDNEAYFKRYNCYDC